MHGETIKFGRNSFRNPHKQEFRDIQLILCIRHSSSGSDRLWELQAGSWKS